MTTPDMLRQMNSKLDLILQAQTAILTHVINEFDPKSITPLQQQLVQLRLKLQAAVTAAKTDLHLSGYTAPPEDNII